MLALIKQIHFHNTHSNFHHPLHHHQYPLLYYFHLQIEINLLTNIVIIIITINLIIKVFDFYYKKQFLPHLNVIY